MNDLTYNIVIYFCILAAIVFVCLDTTRIASDTLNQGISAITVIGSARFYQNLFMIHIAISLVLGYDMDSSAHDCSNSSVLAMELS